MAIAAYQSAQVAPPVVLGLAREVQRTRPCRSACCSRSGEACASAHAAPVHVLPPSIAEKSMIAACEQPGAVFQRGRDRTCFRDAQCASTVGDGVVPVAGRAGRCRRYVRRPRSPASGFVRPSAIRIGARRGRQNWHACVHPRYGLMVHSERHPRGLRHAIQDRSRPDLVEPDVEGLGRVERPDCGRFAVSGQRRSLPTRSIEVLPAHEHMFAWFFGRRRSNEVGAPRAGHSWEPNAPVPEQGSDRPARGACSRADRPGRPQGGAGAARAGDRDPADRAGCWSPTSTGRIPGSTCPCACSRRSRC